MKQIRFGVFETNSSSTHSITIVSEEDFDKWKAGELIFDKYNDKLVPLAKANIANANDEDDDYEDSDEYQTYDDWNDFEYLETYIERFTTKNGDKIVAFGMYGNDNY